MEELSEALQDDQDYEASALTYSENANEDSLMEELKDQLEITEESNENIGPAGPEIEILENSSANIEEELKELDQNLQDEDDVFKQIEGLDSENQISSSENFQYDAEQALENLLIDESNVTEEPVTTNGETLSDSEESALESEKLEVPTSSIESNYDNQDSESIEQTVSAKNPELLSTETDSEIENEKKPPPIQPTIKTKEPFFLSLEFLVEEPSHSKNTIISPNSNSDEKNDSLTDLGDLNQKIEKTIQYFHKEVITENTSKENKPLVLNAQDMVSNYSSEIDIDLKDQIQKFGSLLEKQILDSGKNKNLSIRDDSQNKSNPPLEFDASDKNFINTNTKNKKTISLDTLESLLFTLRKKETST